MSASINLQNFGSCLQAMQDNKRPTVIIMGTGELARSFANTMGAQNALNFVVFGQNLNKAKSVVQDILHGAAALPNYPLHDPLQPEKVAPPGPILKEVLENKNSGSKSRLDDGRAKGYQASLLYNVFHDKQGNPISDAEYSANKDSVAKPVVAMAISDKNMLKELMSSADMVYYTLGKSEKRALAEKGPKGLVRREQLQENLEILAENAEPISYAKKAIHVITPNPDNLIARAYGEMTGLEPMRVLTVGSLVDSLRLKNVLAEEVGGSMDDIPRAWVLGEHGPKMTVAWNHASIGEQPAEKFLHKLVKNNLESSSGLVPSETDIQKTLGQFKERLQQEAVRVAPYILLSTRSGTEIGPVAAAVKVAKTILMANREEDMVCGFAQKGHQGEPVLGMPVRLQTGMVTELEVSLSDDVKKQLAESARELNAEFQRPEVQGIIAPVRDRIAIKHKYNIDPPASANANKSGPSAV